MKKSLFNAIVLYELSNWVRLNLSLAIGLIFWYGINISNDYIGGAVIVVNLIVFPIYLVVDCVVFSFFSGVFTIHIAYIASFVLFWALVSILLPNYTSSDSMIVVIISCLIGYLPVAYCYWRTVKRWGL